jgi:hypothetical protein
MDITAIERTIPNLTALLRVSASLFTTISLMKTFSNAACLQSNGKRQNICNGTFTVSVDAIAEKNNVDETATAVGETRNSDGRAHQRHQLPVQPE